MRTASDVVKGSAGCQGRLHANSREDSPLTLKLESMPSDPSSGKWPNLTASTKRLRLVAALLTHAGIAGISKHAAPPKAASQRILVHTTNHYSS